MIGMLLVIPLADPAVARSLLHLAKELLVAGERVCMSWVAGEVRRLIRVAGDMVELEPWPLDVAAHSRAAVVGLQRMAKLRLPAARRPEVRGKRVGQGMGDVPDQFPLPIPYHPHRVIHLDLVEGVAGEQGLMMLGCTITENGNP